MRTVRGSKAGWHNLKAKKKPKPKPTYKPAKCYAVTRKNALEALGYSSYKEYLKGPEWKKIREDILSKFNFCILCSRSATVVHHLSYDAVTLVGGHTERLVSMCHNCHENIEIDEKGEKRTLFKANVTLFQKALDQKTGSVGRRWAHKIYFDRFFKPYMKYFKKQKEREQAKNAAS